MAIITSIPEPKGDLASMLETVRALKQAVEVIAGQRGDKAKTAYATASDIASIKLQLQALSKRVTALGG